MTSPQEPPKGVLERLRGACGAMHLWIICVNLCIAIALGGVFWGSLTTQVEGLRREIERDRDAQTQWNSDERRTDDIHRERMNQIERQLFDAILLLQSKANKD
jgi:hypothetical protein